jgi:hypothetical protein
VPRRKARIDLCRSREVADFSFSETQRAQVEAAFGYKLPPSAWERVEDCTCMFGLMPV